MKRPLRVYNFAIPGYCTVQELIVAQTYAPRVEPDAIILGFFAGNDLIPNALTQIDDMGNFSPVDELVERFRHDLRAELGPWRHSVIARTLFLTGPSSTRLLYRLGRQSWVLEQNNNDSRPVCQLLPSSGGVGTASCFSTRSTAWPRVGARPFTPVRMFSVRSSAFCERAEIPFVDMRSEFLAEGDWEPFILKGDAHCSALGVRKTAEAIYQQLIRPELVRDDVRLTSRRDVVFFHHVATSGEMRLRSMRIGRPPMIHGSNESIELAMTDTRPVWPDPQWSLVGPEYPYEPVYSRDRREPRQRDARRGRGGV